MNIVARLVATAAAIALVPASAPAELMIAPTRLVLSPANRSAELVLVNKSDQQAAFRISLENRRMAQDGSMESAEAARPGELFAADKLRVTPRQLVMAPGERQTLRISGSDLQGLAPGEYRAHLRLMSAPIAEAKTAAAPAGDSTSLSIQLVAIRSLTIPVIVRVGTLDAQASVETASFTKPDRSILAVRLARSGTRSTYGDIHLTVEGSAAPAYHVRGIAVYVPNASRDVIIPIPDAVRAKLAGRRVRVDYVSSDPGDAGRKASLTVQL